ncbi:MAG: hypothetical protein MJZ76_01910 [Bacteroidales bacterium]|nr:hypothetical protein [Bacteroidales bacterium]
MKKKYRFSSGETFMADKTDLQQLLQQNKEYLQNYLELFGSQEDDEFVARGNGFCDSKFSENFLDAQIEKYQQRVLEITQWLAE